MMTSGPAGESEVLSLLRVISDPNGASERLKLLSDKAALLAEQEEKFNREAAETTARIKEQQDKADADAATAAANLAEANRLLEANRAADARNAGRADDMRAWCARLDAREKDFTANTQPTLDAIATREVHLAAKEAKLAAALAQAEASATAAINLKADYEGKLAQLRAQLQTIAE